MTEAVSLDNSGGEGRQRPDVRAGLINDPELLMLGVFGFCACSLNGFSLSQTSFHPRLLSFPCIALEPIVYNDEWRLRQYVKVACSVLFEE